jgi:RNA polymerase sigma factor (sigma-70 family)
MVFGVCRRILRDTHAAEDAFQATFLVLARKASSVIPREKVANWLYGVAYRTAHEARIRALRRRAREEKVATRRVVQTIDQASHKELMAILDDELACLPARYRGPIVLCELEGLSRQEAAQRLGVPEGTVSSRLARAKTRLRDRLARRGMAVPAGALSFVAIREASAAVLTESLIESTALVATRVAAGISAAGVVSTSVVSLTEGVLKSMLLTKLKGIALVLGSSVAVVSGAVALGQTAPAGQSTSRSDTERMTVMERKLDRIIDALDRMSGGTNGPFGGPNVVSRDQVAKTPLYEASKDARFFTPKGVPPRQDDTISADMVKTGPSPPPVSLERRIDVVERDLHHVKDLLAQLAHRVNELESRGQSAEPGNGFPKKAK